MTSCARCEAGADFVVADGDDETPLCPDHAEAAIENGAGVVALV